MLKFRKIRQVICPYRAFIFRNCVKCSVLGVPHPSCTDFAQFTQRVDAAGRRTSKSSEKYRYRPTDYLTGILTVSATAYQTAPIPITTLSNFEGHFSHLKPLKFPYFEKCSTCYL